jgi:hypothetical protein
MVERVSAVLMVSRDAGNPANFYRGVLEIPLRDEQHDDTALHCGCTLGDMHSAVHPVENWSEAPATGAGGVRIAFRTRDAEAAAATLRSKGIRFAAPWNSAGRVWSI